MHLNAGRFPFGNGTHRAEHRGAAAHVELHHVDLSPSHLEVVPAGIEGEPLANQRQATRQLTFRSIHQVDQLGVEVRPLAHRQEGTHASRLAIGAFEHRQLQPIALRNFSGGLGQGCGGHHVRWGRHQLPGQLHTGAIGIHPLEARGGLGGQAD